MTEILVKENYRSFAVSGCQVVVCIEISIQFRFSNKQLLYYNFKLIIKYYSAAMLKHVAWPETADLLKTSNTMRTLKQK
jgi:hypothetical protein